MTAAPVRFTAFTRNPRGEMIAKVRDALIASGGWIIDFHEYSNVSLCLNFEISGQKIPPLLAALRQEGLELTEESQSLQAAKGGESDGVSGTLQITFIHQDPDLIIPVPAIPG